MKSLGNYQLFRVGRKKELAKTFGSVVCEMEAERNVYGSVDMHLSSFLFSNLLQWLEWRNCEMPWKVDDAQSGENSECLSQITTLEGFQHEIYFFPKS